MGDRSRPRPMSGSATLTIEVVSTTRNCAVAKTVSPIHARVEVRDTGTGCGRGFMICLQVHTPGGPPTARWPSDGHMWLS